METPSLENVKLAQLTVFLALSQESVTLAPKGSTFLPPRLVPPAEPTVQPVTLTEDVRLASTIPTFKTTEPVPRKPGIRNGGFGS